MRADSRYRIVDVLRSRGWVAALASIALLVGCTPPSSTNKVEVRVPVTVREVSTATVEDRVVVTGTLRAVETVQLRADTAGLLKIARDAAGRRLAEGSRVRAGQVIAEVQGEDVRLAARTEATLQAYEQAQRDFEQQQRLFDDGLISEADFLPAKTRLADTKLEWERSLLTEDRSRLITPIDGVLLRLARGDDDTPLADGHRVDPGVVLAQVIPDGGLIADVDLVGPDAVRVRPSLEARVRYFAWDDQLFDGQVLRLAPAVDPTTRTLRAEVAVANPERVLRPGMFVEVTIVTERRPDVAVVPREAVTERAGAKVVFLLNGQAVKKQEVSLGLGDDDIVEIRSGLQPGDRVVVRGIETLTDEQKVLVKGT